MTHDEKKNNTMSQHEAADLDEMHALYASGALSPEEAAAFEQRLFESGQNPSNYDGVVNALASGIEPIEPDASVKASLMNKIKSEPQGPVMEHAEAHPNRAWDQWESSPSDPSALFTLHRDDSGWEDTGIEGIEVRRLFVDRPNNRMTALFRMAPGTSYVPHIHDGYEECYVLEGDLRVGDDIVLHAGDYQRANAGSLHGVQRTEGGCVLLISSSLSDEQCYTDDPHTH